jgi:hypothetical protein
VRNPFDTEATSEPVCEPPNIFAAPGEVDAAPCADAPTTPGSVFAPDTAAGLNDDTAASVSVRRIGRGLWRGGAFARHRVAVAVGAVVVGLGALVAPIVVSSGRRDSAAPKLPPRALAPKDLGAHREPRRARSAWPLRRARLARARGRAARARRVQRRHLSVAGRELAPRLVMPSPGVGVAPALPAPVPAGAPPEFL